MGTSLSIRVTTCLMRHSFTHGDQTWLPSPTSRYCEQNARAYNQVTYCLGTHTHTHTRGLYLNGASRQLMLGLKNRGGRFADHTGSIGSSYHQRQPAPAASSLTPAFAVNTRSSPSLGLTHCHTPAVKHFLHFSFPPKFSANSFDMHAFRHAYIPPSCFSNLFPFGLWPGSHTARLKVATLVLMTCT